MEAWSRLQEAHADRAVIVAVRQIEPGIEACARQAPAARLLLDPAGRTAKRYNALWLPRAYALDERGAVTYAQPANTLDLQAPLAVAALWRTAR